MKKAILILAFYSTNFAIAQVGIGTTTPSSNSVLDITSPNKGLMLPRLNDTSLVTDPSAGLLIFNMNSKLPAFHNGAKWSSLSATSSTATDDSLTYTITGATNGFTNGTFKLESVSHGISNPGEAGTPSFSSITFLKFLDINSIGFAKAVATGPVQGSMVFEIKFYSPGSATPYYSWKASTIKVEAFQVSAGTGGYFTESASIVPVIFGYKDWINNLSFAWNESTKTVVPY